MTVRSRVWDAVTGLAKSPNARPVVRAFTALHALAYRVTGGRAQAKSYPTLVLSVPGRSSGTIRSTPLVYIRDGEDFIVCAAYSGAEKNPAWWSNLKAAGSGTVQQGSAVTTRTAHEVMDDDHRERLWQQLVAMYPPFTSYEQRTDRQFPIIRLS